MPIETTEWGAQILSIDAPTLDRPEYVLKLRCPKKTYQQITSRRNQGGRLYSITNDHSEDENEWKRKEDSQNHNATRGDTQEAGKWYSKIRGQPSPTKDGMVEFSFVSSPRSKTTPPLASRKMTLAAGINDVSRDLIQIDRQRKGIERLQELVGQQRSRVAL